MLKRTYSITVGLIQLKVEIKKIVILDYSYI